jgi:hypothetical protein
MQRLLNVDIKLIFNILYYLYLNSFEKCRHLKSHKLKMSQEFKELALIHISEVSVLMNLLTPEKGQWVW